MKAMLRRKNVFERAEITINWVKTLIGETSEVELIGMFGHLAKSYYDRYKNELSEREMMLYDALLKEGLNPATVYEWLLAAQLDDNNKRLLLKNKISQKKATCLGRVQVMRIRARHSLAFLGNARNLVHTLEWRSLE